MAVLMVLFPLCLQSQEYARNGMVVSSSEIASEVGIEVLKKGGNAIDASVATAFTLAVTLPSAGNIGGGGFLVFMDAKGKATTIDFREKAPLAAHRDMYLDENGQLIKDLNHQGALSIGVPGTVAGLYLAHQKYGYLPWRDLVMPAVTMAREGFRMPWGLSEDAHRLTNDETKPHFLRHYFLNDHGEVAKFGKVWKQPALAHTLQLIADRGKDGFYAGEVAEEIERYMKENGGIITKEDLQKYEAVERKPIHGTFKGYDIYSMPPPSSGGVVLVEMLNMMEHANLDSIEFNSAKYFHLLAEIMRRGFADRAEYLGDPDFNPDMPLQKLTSKEYAKSLFENIDMDSASLSDPSGFGHPYGGDNTTHFSVIDRDGNAVSLTYTLEYSYGSGMGSEKLGFIFNNEMGDFNPVPGLTNSRGLIGTDPNLIEPQKRMLSSMTPTIVAKDGRPYLIIGSPGGRTIINTVFQTILCVLAYDMPLFKAIEYTKIHHQWLPDQIYYEEGLMSPDTRKLLEGMGHTMQAKNSLGRLMGIMYDAENKLFIGVSDSSAPDGAAVGY